MMARKVDLSQSEANTDEVLALETLRKVQLLEGVVMLTKAINHHL